MVNPFDRSFFRFFIGFVMILAVSFGFLYFVGRYNSSMESQASSADPQ